MKNLLLSVGHGRQPNGVFDNGAFNNKDGIKEFDLNVDMVGIVAHKLTQYPIITTLDNAILGNAHNPSWIVVKGYLNTHVYDLVVELHHDSASAADVGFGIRPRASFSGLKQLTDNIEREYEVRGLRTKPSYNDKRGLGLLKVTRSPVLIWECGRTASTSVITKDLRAEAIAAGIVNYLGLPVVAPRPNNGQPLRRGAKGEAVYKLQAYLMATIKTPLVLDGQFGPATELAVKQWQHLNLFNETGVVEYAQLKKMGIV